MTVSTRGLFSVSVMRLCCMERRAGCTGAARMMLISISDAESTFQAHPIRSDTHIRKKMLELSNRWATSMVTGGSPLVMRGPCSFPAVSSADGKHSIVLLSRQLRVYFLQTRHCIRTVDVDLLEVVAVCLDPVNTSNLACFTPKGVFYVTWQEKLPNPVVARLTMEPPVEGFVDVFLSNKDCYYALAENDSVLSVVSIERETSKTCTLFEFEGAHRFAVSRNSHKLAVVLESLQALLFDLSAAVSSVVTKHSHLAFQDAIENTKETFPFPHKLVTCLAVSNSGIIALGTMQGHIQVLYGGSSSGTPKGFLRWHIDPVRSVEFSVDETYLVSGGMEKVMVFWHLILDRAQFLPRLSGPIDRIYSDLNRPDHYSVALRVAEGSKNRGVHELVVISGLDLISRLSYSPVCPSFLTPINKALNAARKRHQKVGGDVQVITNDITVKLNVHPTTKHLYTAEGSSVQAYDLIKGEQAFVQHIAPKLSTGKVRSEKKLVDPEVKEVAFTTDGAWMATFDSMPSLNFDNLMSKNDTSYALKFWFWSDSSWTLTLKIVDPHGPGLEIGCILSNSVDAFTTVDKNGGIRIWRPRPNNPLLAVKSTGSASKKHSTQTVWTLRRASLPSTISAPVAACYAPDGSFLVVSHDNVAKIHDFSLLQEIDFSIPHVDLPIDSLAITGSYLVITSQLKVLLYDLVSASESPAFLRVFARGIGNLVAVDGSKNLIAVAYNECHIGAENSIHSTITIFDPHSLKPIHKSSFKKAIASLISSPSGFLFINTDSEVGVLAPELKKNKIGNSDEDDITAQMNKMLINAQAAANVLFAKTVNRAVENNDLEDSTKYTSQKTIDPALLLSIFSNVDGVGLDSLFEKVVRVTQ